METILRLKDTTVFYDHKKALSNVSMDIKKHRITAIIGPSGCGKSTVLHCLNGMIMDIPGAKMEGDVYFNEKNLKAFSSEAVRRQIGFVFQTPTPFPFSIYKNMTYGLKYYGIRDKKTLEQLVTEKLKMTGLYEEVKDDMGKNARKLSGGQQQRLCIARALTVEPEILLLDEPCSALDAKSTAVIEDLLVKLKSSYTIVIVTHNMGQARRIADDVIAMEEGQVIKAGTAGEVLNELEYGI